MLNFLRKKLAVSDPDRFLKTDHLMADLKGRSVRGGVATLGSQAFRFALQMGTTAVLARLLAPEDYGLIGMTTVVTGFITIFKDMGLSEATIQKDEITHKQVSTLFWLNLGMGLSLALVVIALSPLVAYFYQEPKVRGIMMALSINFVFSGLTVQHNALIKRQMQFTKAAKITVFSNMIGPTVAIISASMGNGYWALVHMFNASTFSYMVAIWFTCRWRPGLPDFDSGIGPMLKFGGNLTGFQLVNYFSRNFDNILIGRVWGPAQLGLYAKAYQLVLLPIQQINNPVNNVAMPALSRLQGQPEKYKRFYYKAILLITSIGMPIICLLSVTANEVIVLVLGSQWTEAATTFLFLMPSAFLATFNVATGWAFQSLGYTDRQLKWGLIGSTINVTAFIVGVRWGANGVALAFSLSAMLQLPFRLAYCYRGTPLSISDLFNTLSRPAIASIGTASAIFLIDKLLLNTNSIFLALAFKSVLFGASYSLMWISIPGGRKQFLELSSTFRQLKKKRL